MWRKKSMEYLTATEVGEKWNISARRVGILCAQGRLDGAVKKGHMWLIPETAEKPGDGRRKEYKQKKVED
jgi:hypothetical protein